MPLASVVVPRPKKFNMTKKTVILYLIFISSNVFSQQLAFPGAEGYGRFTTGGRGGIVIEVTNLNDTGTGSFRAACLSGSPRTIIFRVSGTIFLESAIKIKNGNLTIAGQTAPGDGICIANYTTLIQADNVIVRYLRFRMGNEKGYQGDAFGGRQQKNIIIDHCSMSWSVDEVGSFYDNKNFTMQWCILSESLYDAGRIKDKQSGEQVRHGFGGIQGGMGASFHHNLYADNTSRNPRFSGARKHPGTANEELVDFRNNVIFNWGYKSAYGGESGHQNMINNYYKAGPATKESKKSMIVEIGEKGTDPGKWYINGNYIEGSPHISSNNWNGGVQGPAADADSARMEMPFPFAPVKTQSAEEAYISVLQNVGATLPKRDRVDERIINQLKSGRCTSGDSYGVNTGIIDSVASVGRWPLLQSTTAPIDTDHDGIPDVWETSHELNPNNAEDRNTLDTNGYTMLEEYLNSIE